MQPAQGLRGTYGCVPRNLRTGDLADKYLEGRQAFEMRRMALFEARHRLCRNGLPSRVFFTVQRAPSTMPPPSLLTDGTGIINGGGYVCKLTWNRLPRARIDTLRP